MTERVYFKDNPNRVVVTDRRFVAEKSTYPIKQIASVASVKVTNVEKGMSKTNSASRQIQIGLIVGFVIVLVLAFVSPFVIREIFLIVAGVMFVLYWVAAIFFPYQKPFNRTETLYGVMIGLSSGQTNAFSSKDETLITNIVNALNQSIIENA